MKRIGGATAAVLALLFACGDGEDSGGATPSPDGGGPGDADGSSPATDGGTPGDPDSGVTPPPASIDCAALPAPSGTVIDVTPAQADQLASIVQNAAEGSTIRLADGVYKMTVSGEAARRLQFKTKGVTMRSASGKRDAVVIDAEYQTNEAIVVMASNVTIAHLTVTHATDHPIHVTGGATADITGTLLYDLHVVDGGEQQIKVNTSGGQPNTFADDGRLECSLVEVTDAGRPNIETLGGTSCYTGGIDAHQTRGWAVRANTFKGIWCADHLAEHAIHFWNGARDTLVERNTIIDCARGVGFGLLESGVSRQYADNPYPGLYVGHYDGIIRNNFISAVIPAFDTGIELDQARGTKVFHNTVFHPATAFSSIDRRFDNTLVDLTNNIVVKLTDRNGAKGAAAGNLEGATSALFADATKGDLHLVSGAASAIDKATALPDPGLDIDGKAHDVGAPDIGAHERR